MFYLPGYIPLETVTARFLRDSLRNAKKELGAYFDDPLYSKENNDGARFDGLERTILFCWSAKFKGVVSPNGQVVSVSDTIFEGWDQETGETRCVHLLTGTVGSGSDYTGESVSEYSCQVAFGPFAFCPIVFKEDEFEQYYSNATGETALAQPLFSKDAENVAELRVGRGRPRHGGGLVEIAIRNEFRGRMARGELSTKKEATYAEAQEWALRILETNVSRNTVARYLARLWEGGDAQK